MSFFAGIIRLDVGPVPESFAARIAAAPWLADRCMRWHESPGLVAAVGLDRGGARGTIARWKSALAIGTIRLDNRAEVARRVGCDAGTAPDLELALRALSGARAMRADQLVGDFAFVIWNEAARRLLAVRDTFGVKRLYYSTPTPDVVEFASRAELLAGGDEYDIAYLAARLADRVVPRGRTVYAGVRELPGASTLRAERGVPPVVTAYWSAFEAQAAGDVGGSERDRIAAFRDLLVEGVRLRVADGPRTWSHLSGGLDSSSVASVAQWLAATGEVPHGLAGAVTFTDPFGTGADEKAYSDAVARHHGLRNELVSHHSSWKEILLDPPRLDQPTRTYRSCLRDRRAAEIIHGAGGEVLLTGIGGDHLVLNTMFFFADWIVAGRAVKAVREMAHRAALGRVSFWRLAYENTLLPLVPDRLQRVLRPDRHAPVSPWLDRALLRRHGLERRAAVDRGYGGPRGGKYAHNVATTIAATAATMPEALGEDVLDVRHPFLHRPLVELALSLPPEMSVRPHARKWVLREAMRGILPEVVRTRVGKGSAQGLTTWALVNEPQRVAELLRDPILAQLGCIDPKALRDAVAEVGRLTDPESTLPTRVHVALETELWLQLRAGRWVAA